MTTILVFLTGNMKEFVRINDKPKNIHKLR